MGSVASKMKMKNYKRHQKPQVLVLGLDGAGKTSIVHVLDKGEFAEVPMTVSYNYTQLRKKKHKHFIIWDIGGQEKLRQTWRHYFFGIKVLVFVLDASDRQRLREAHHELHMLVEDEMLKDVPLLVLCNKMDVVRERIEKGDTEEEEKGSHHLYPVYKSPEDVMDIIKKSFHDCKGTYMGVSAKSGEGIQETFEWLVSKL